MLPFFQVYTGQRISSKWTKDTVTEAYFGVTEKGWMETDVLHGQLANRSLKQIPPLRSVGLLLNGHVYRIWISTSANFVPKMRFCYTFFHSIVPTTI